MSNRKWEKLTDAEKGIVQVHYDECMADTTMECHRLHNNIVEFWESHKEMDYPDWE